MSNYVNNVNVQGATYTLGPLMSTSNGGVVDNTSLAYTSGDNVIIGCDISNITQMGAEIYYSDLDNNAFIHCNISDFKHVACSFNYADDTNVYLGVNASDFREAAIPIGINNVVMARGSGIHGTATKTVNGYALTSSYVGIQFPAGSYELASCEYVGTISLAAITGIKYGYNYKPIRSYVVLTTVGSTITGPDGGSLPTNTYYVENKGYIASELSTQTSNIYFSIDYNGIILYYDMDSDPTLVQLTMSYDFVPALVGGSSSGSDSGSSSGSSDDSNYGSDYSSGSW